MRRLDREYRGHMVSILNNWCFQVSSVNFSRRTHKVEFIYRSIKTRCWHDAFTGHIILANIHKDISNLQCGHVIIWAGKEGYKKNDGLWGKLVYSVTYTSLLWGTITEQKVPPGSYIFCRSKATKLHFQNLSYHVQNTCSGTEFGIGNFMDIFKDNLGSVPAVLVAPKPGVFAQTSGRLQRNTEVF